LELRILSRRQYPCHPIPGVGVIVVSQRGLLLVRRDKDPGKGLWSIPGGGVEVGETQEIAAIREVREETGVEIELLELVSTADLVTVDSQGCIQYHYLLNHYLAVAQTLTTQAEYPWAEVNWFRPDCLPLEEMPYRIQSLLQEHMPRILGLFRAIRADPSNVSPRAKKYKSHRPLRG
jgi:ADP-ribose pyrophosphatase YjhB (NUDIX family)